MAKSMTGFGRLQQVVNGREINIEIKSVNSRYFEYSSRLPRSMAFMDEKVKKVVAAVAARGKVDVHVSAQALEGAQVSISANLPVARSYVQALNVMAEDLQIANDLKLSNIARLPDVFNVQRAEEDEDVLVTDVLTVTRGALMCFDEMRAAEGEKLVADVRARLNALLDMVEAVEADSEGRMQRYIDKLSQRLAEVLGDKNIDETRLISEAALFADKTAVAEETVRLRSHIEQYRDILTKDEPVGRKLDFLTQELNREVNTIGSKCQELEITRVVVDMKAEIEKIREQVQNLE